MLKRYRHDLDILKGISILAILLYHIGLLPYGYLGVDTFLVINGFLIIPSLISDIANGNYSYGKCFGRLYAKRHKANYYESKIPIIPLCQKTNEDWKKDWGENNFIDFMDVTKTEGDSIRLFTDNQKVISFDCKHLTEDGARFYAERLDLDRIFQNSNKIN